ncbi:MAG: glycine betaine ABC transporter substrate-binding protein, partial [bacterium]
MVLIVLSASLLVTTGLFHGCSRNAATDEQINIVYINWTEDVAMTHVLAVLLEDRLGYNVDLTMADVAPAYTSLASGSQDLFLDAWLPNTHAPYWERYGDRLVDLGRLYEDARIGLVVPADAPGQSIGDLRQYRDAYNGRIIGIDAGAGIMRRSEEALKAYGLHNYELVASSEPAMTAALRDAVEEERP